MGIEAVAESIQKELGEDGSLLVGFIIVSEWVNAEGGRWLARNYPSDTVSEWQAEGYLQAGLSGEWDEDE